MSGYEPSLQRDPSIPRHLVTRSTRLLWWRQNYGDLAGPSASNTPPIPPTPVAPPPEPKAPATSSIRDRILADSRQSDMKVREQQVKFTQASSIEGQSFEVQEVAACWYKQEFQGKHLRRSREETPIMIRTLKIVSQILEGKHKSVPKLTLAQICQAIQYHALEALHPDYDPAMVHQKEYLKSYSLEDFLIWQDPNLFGSKPRILQLLQSPPRRVRTNFLGKEEKLDQASMNRLTLLADHYRNRLGDNLPSTSFLPLLNLMDQFSREKGSQIVGGDSSKDPVGLSMQMIDVMTSRFGDPSKWNLGMAASKLGWSILEEDMKRTGLLVI